MSATDVLTSWLTEHEFRLDRFHVPVPLAEVASETGLAAADIRRALRDADLPVHHVWPQHRLYCLRPAGPDHVGLDQEDSVLGAVERDFHERGYQTARELGTPEHVAALLERPDLAPLTSGVNQRDLWALRRDGDSVELWIVEAKGKQAAGFEHYVVAEALAQVLPVRGEHLTTMLGAAKGDSQGRCLAIARTLLDGWSAAGLEATVRVAILLPSSAPDVVWKSGKPTPTPEGVYAEPLRALRDFLVTGERPYEDDRSQARRAFGDLLLDVDAGSSLRELAAAKSGLCFRVLTAGAHPKSGAFEIGGREPVKMSFIRRTADRIREKFEGLTSTLRADEAEPEPPAPERELEACRRDLAALCERVDEFEPRLAGVEMLEARCAAIEERLARLASLRTEIARARSLSLVALAAVALVAAAGAVMLWVTL